MSANELDYQKADKEHLQTWEGLKKLFLWSSICTVVTLAGLAFFFGG